jgi:hypothetical protein
MDSLNSSVSFPNALNSAKPPKGSTISASCSFRSHLSTANSQKRLRAASYVAPSSEERSPSDVDLETSHSAPSSSFSLPALVSEFVPFSRQSQDGHVSWTARTFKWLAVTFCLLSVLVMTSHLVAARSRRTVTTQLLAPVVGGMLMSFARVNIPIILCWRIRICFLSISTKPAALLFDLFDRASAACSRAFCSARRAYHPVRLSLVLGGGSGGSSHLG